MTRPSCLFVAAILSAFIQPAPKPDPEAAPFEPRQYVCYRTSTPVIIDGRLDDQAWKGAPWTAPFVDIEGNVRPKPRFLTRAKMLWDDEAFYIAAEMEEPDVWGTLTARDSVIFHDNDFEVFIDPDGDTHEYYELEVNALNTVWDLLLVRPYRDGGPAIDAWDIAGLRTAVSVRGRINSPGTPDEGWSVEIAMPWRILREAAPGRKPPAAGQQWRVNFSRVEWAWQLTTGQYERKKDPPTGRASKEDNWVWSPQGLVDMHMPERWGFVQFSGRSAGTGEDAFVEDRNERVKWALRRLYYRQRRFREAHAQYARTIGELGGDTIRVDGLDFRPVMEAAGGMYEITAAGFDGAIVHLRHDGRVWVMR